MFKLITTENMDSVSVKPNQLVIDTNTGLMAIDKGPIRPQSLTEVTLNQPAAERLTVDLQFEGTKDGITDVIEPVTVVFEVDEVSKTIPTPIDSVVYIQVNSVWNDAGDEVTTTYNPLTKVTAGSVTPSRVALSGEPKFTNTSPTTISLGGIKQGTIFEDEPITAVLNRLLYPHIDAEVSSASVSHSPSGTLEHGTAVTYNAVNATIKKGSASVTSVRIMGYSADQTTISADLVWMQEPIPVELSVWVECSTSDSGENMEYHSIVIPANQTTGYITLEGIHDYVYLNVGTITISDSNSSYTDDDISNNAYVNVMCLTNYGTYEATPAQLNAVNSSGSGTVTWDIPDYSNGSNKSKAYAVDVTDADGVTITKNNIQSGPTYVYPYYWGVINADEDVTASNVAALTKLVQTKGTKTVAYTANYQKMVFASTSSVTQIKDPNGFNVTDTFAHSTFNITGKDGTSQEYHVYVSDPTTVASFNMTFSH